MNVWKKPVEMKRDRRESGILILITREKCLFSRTFEVAGKLPTLYYEGHYLRERSIPFGCVLFHSPAKRRSTI